MKCGEQLYRAATSFFSPLSLSFSLPPLLFQDADKTLYVFTIIYHKNVFIFIIILVELFFSVLSVYLKLMLQNMATYCDNNNYNNLFWSEY